MRRSVLREAGRRGEDVRTAVVAAERHTGAEEDGHRAGKAAAGVGCSRLAGVEDTADAHSPEGEAVRMEADGPAAEGSCLGAGDPVAGNIRLAEEGDIAVDRSSGEEAADRTEVDSRPGEDRAAAARSPGEEAVL